MAELTAQEQKTEVGEEEVIATYAERIVTLQPDEAGQELTQKNRGGEHFNREKIVQNEFRGLSLIGSLTRVEYGRWRETDACLIGMRFQFLGGKQNSVRVREADILIEFTARRPHGQPDHDPCVLNYGPKSLTSGYSEGTQGWRHDVQFSAKANLGLVTLGLSFGGGQNESRQRRYATTVESSDWGDDKHEKANCVKFWLEEDENQATGVPMELRLAVVVGFSGPFQCTVCVDARTTLLTDKLLNGWPWSKDDPVLFKQGIPFHGIREDQGLPNDFAELSEVHWRQLVTPDLTVMSRDRKTPAFEQ